MSRRRAAPENHERWLVSYADFITLMFAFFVVMFASSEVDRKKVEQFSQGYSAYLEGGPRAVSLLSVDDDAAGAAGGLLGETGPTRLELTAMEMAPIQTRIREILDRLLIDDQVRLSLEARGLVISLQEAALFSAGDARFSDGAEEMLQTLAEAVAVAPGRQIRLEGHTDDRPIRTERFPSNWELSGARAIEVMRALADRHGLEEGRVSVAGYGANRPIASNGTEEGRAQNRRVDIVILAEDAAANEPGMTADGAN